MDSLSVGGICRCCASEGPAKDLVSEYHWMGEQEIYSEMLRECLDISLYTPENETSNGGICEVCITQLRSAHNFKKQVLLTEEMFKSKLGVVSHKNMKFLNEDVRLKDVKVERDDSSSSDNSLDDADETEFEVPIKTEEIMMEDVLEEPVKRPKPGPSRAKKPKVEGAAKRQSPKTRESRQGNYDKHLPDLVKHSHNLTTILRWSNATPFKDRNVLGYICAYCFKPYADPAILRSHTRNDHEKHLLAYKTGKDLNSFQACLDIVDLQCKICDEKIDGLDDLIAHLIKTHGKKYYSDINSCIQPFKLTVERSMQCCLCNDSFDHMKSLMSHMNNHFRNYICLSCGAGFINKRRLASHEATHDKKKITYPCKHCAEVFEYSYKRKAHINTVHKGLSGDNICQICKSRFKNYYQKSLHMVEIHKTEAIKCDLCEKKFIMRSSLLQHLRRDHMKERTHACNVCHLKFFCKKRMLEHAVVHTGQKEFSCDVCGKAFARRKNLKVHLKTHVG